MYLALGTGADSPLDLADRFARTRFEGSPARVLCREFFTEGSRENFKARISVATSIEGHCREVIVFDAVERLSRDALAVLLSLIEGSAVPTPLGKPLHLNSYFLWLTAYVPFSGLPRELVSRVLCPVTFTPDLSL